VVRGNLGKRLAADPESWAAHRHGALMLIDCVVARRRPVEIDRWGIDTARSKRTSASCPPGLAPVTSGASPP
jgi:aspartate aminotransferase-like enzyme